MTNINTTAAFEAAVNEAVADALAPKKTWSFGKIALVAAGTAVAAGGIYALARFLGSDVDVAEVVEAVTDATETVAETAEETVDAVAGFFRR